MGTGFANHLPKSDLHYAVRSMSAPIIISDSNHIARIWWGSSEVMLQLALGTCQTQGTRGGRQKRSNSRVLDVVNLIHNVQEGM